MTQEPERSDPAKRADQVVTEFTEWALKYQKMGYPSLWRKRLVDLVAAAVAEAVSRTKADAVALCAAEFERGLLSGRADVAEAVKEPRTVPERRDALFTARAEVQSLRKVLKERDARLAEAREAQYEVQQRVLKLFQGLYHALVGVALHGVDDDEGEPSPLQAFCDDGWLCEHAECVAARDAMTAVDQETQGVVRSRAALTRLRDPEATG